MIFLKFIYLFYYLDLPSSLIFVGFSLFSRNVARYYPNTLASLIVRSYHSFSPGEIANQWKSNPSNYHSYFKSKISNWLSQRNRMKRLTILGIFILFLQRLGAYSPALQKFILHLLQPLVLGGICFIGYQLSKDPFRSLTLWYPRLWV